jgi:hypothetical protein
MTVPMNVNSLESAHEPTVDGCRSETPTTWANANEPAALVTKDARLHGLPGLASVW